MTTASTLTANNPDFKKDLEHSITETMLLVLLESSYARRREAMERLHEGHSFHSAC
jgi:hypothetical protein